MPNLFIFADETGCFTFSRENNVSKFFILCTITMKNTDIAMSLLDLRRALAWEGADLGDCFHATADKQNVRDRVFETILRHDFSIQATIMEKSKSQPQIRRSKELLYKHAWFYHFKYGMRVVRIDRHEALITAASIGTRRERAAFSDAIDDVMKQILAPNAWRTDFVPAATDPCVQVADYCAWAIQRKWERGDVRSYDLIRDRIVYEYDLFGKSTQHYY
jgi:hypothetical protein